ncbi:MAG TPA: nucleoside diphosphate kinase regulator [Terriglobales bacterium]|nr:nucleoside diphosphate kinase regulator [Terriglobales bacterium]
MTKRTIYMTAYDLQRLQPLIESARRYGHADVEALDLLQAEVDRAILCDPNDMPADVVTINAKVRVTDLETGKQLEFTIVFPRQADYEQKMISVLAPIGTALLGYRPGVEVEWPTPGGMRRFRIDEVTAPQRAASVA